MLITVAHLGVFVSWNCVRVDSLPVSYRGFLHAMDFLKTSGVTWWGRWLVVSAFVAKSCSILQKKRVTVAVAVVTKANSEGYILF